ncbi:unnamed protein product [Nyctereutes procyonoides]|uniref:(raccoon dog) hypothetical protein n=1 Tax=Nyctereutes procyonoides TaxID=34880 RepID=A0A811ZWI3_NYCPR|nr:unnamed protein product [Nyctereutes procyonoides]
MGSLLQAYRWAAEKVSEAYKPKNLRLKQYCLQREKDFKAKETLALKSLGSCSLELEKATQEKMTILQTYFHPFQQGRNPG